MLALLANKDNGGFMERVYKTFTGGYSKEKEGKEATHIILTVDEYDKLLYEDCKRCCNIHFLIMR